MWNKNKTAFQNSHPAQAESGPFFKHNSRHFSCELVADAADVEDIER